MNWKKLKRVFCPDDNYDWMKTHASNPVPYIIDEEKGIVRIFFSCRNINNRSSVAFVDVDFNDDFKILRIADEPVLKAGDPGYFDDDGVSVSWVIPVNGKFYLYYLGWNLRVNVPWLNTIGLALTGHLRNTRKCRY